MELKKMLDVHNFGLVLIKTHTVFTDISSCNKRCLLLPQLPLEIQYHISKCAHDKNEQAFSCLIRTKAKGKDKVHSVTCHEGNDREFLIFFKLTSALDGGGCLMPCPSYFTPGNDLVPTV
jgi:hypothetical protein